METSTEWRLGAAALAIALLACAGCSSPSGDAPSASPSPPVVVSPYPSPSEAGAPEVTVLDEPIDCRLALDVLPVTDLAWSTEALRWELLGGGSTEIATVARTPDGTVVTPSAEADDPAALVEAAVARIDAAGFASTAWTLAPAVPWAFDDLCVGVTIVLGEMGTPGGVEGVGIDQDARLRIAILTGTAVPASIVALGTAHPGMLRIVEEAGVDVAP